MNRVVEVVFVVTLMKNVVVVAAIILVAVVSAVTALGVKIRMFVVMVSVSRQ